MHRLPLLLAVALLCAGCASTPPATPSIPSPDADCPEPGPVERTFYLGPEMSLNETPPAEGGTVDGNGFDEAFLNDDLASWYSRPVPEGLLIEGNVTIDVWVMVTGMAAPPDQGEPGEAYTFFNQFGSDRGFQNSFAKETAPVGAVAGPVHLQERLTMPPGGFLVEKGDRLRLLITSLIVDGPTGAGTHVQYGPPGEPFVGFVRFVATCEPPVEWQMQRYIRQPVVILANQGGPVGLPAVECQSTGMQDACLSRFDFPFTLENGTERLRVFVRTPTTSEPKTDVDMRLLDSSGNLVYDASTPHTNETFVLWHRNLEAFAPPGPYIVRVDVYSGRGYSGLLEIAMEYPLDDHH